MQLLYNRVYSRPKTSLSYYIILYNTEESLPTQAGIVQKAARAGFPSQLNPFKENVPNSSTDTLLNRYTHQNGQ